MRAKVFMLENELERLKMEVSEKDQLSEQVYCKLLLVTVCFFISWFDYNFLLHICKGFKKVIPCKIDIPYM